MALSLPNLQAVVAVAETGSFTLAAQRLGRSHATVSRAVASVERELGGVHLFERNQAGTQVTAAGARFAQKVSAALSELDAAVASASR